MPDGVFVGRTRELARLRELVVGVAAGVGGSVLIEGESGIGKSALLSEGLAEVPLLGCDLRWAVAEEWGQQFPLRVMVECLGSGIRAQDPVLVGAGTAARGERGHVVIDSSDHVRAAMEHALALVDQLCVTSSLVIVIDDFQWADEASLLIWERLNGMVEQLPLLLVGACRPTPRPDSLARLRRAMAAGRGVVLDLGPLDPEHAADLVDGLVGAPPGPELRTLAAQAGGNPLYLTELVDALVRHDGVLIAGGRAEPAGESAGGRALTSLAAAIANRLGFLSPETSQALRLAALLGREFTVADLSIVAHRAPSALVAAMDEAVRARVLTSTGIRFAFRHPVIREALYDATPVAMRVALHAEIARMLSAAGVSVERVAEQLLPAAEAADEWMFAWLVEAAPTLTHLAPQIAVQLFEAMTDRPFGTNQERDALASWATIALLRMGRNQEAEAHARRVLARTPCETEGAVMSWALSGALLRSGRGTEAVTALQQTLADRVLSPVWRARLTALLAECLVVTGRSEDAKVAAHLVVDSPDADPLAAAYAYDTLAVERAIYLDIEGFLDFIARGLGPLPGDAAHTDIRLRLLSHRLHGLDALDRHEAAEDTVRQARQLVDRVGRVRFVQVTVSIATHYFISGQWDDALAELESSDDLAPGDPSYLIHHGLKALIAAHRDDRPTAKLHLDAVQDSAALTSGNSWVLWNSVHVMLANALVADQDRRPEDAVAALAVTLGPKFLRGNGRSLCLPALARAAQAVGDDATAREAAALCVEQARTTGIPTMQAAADYCTGLLDREPARLVTAADYYRRAGRRFELAQALEEAAVLFGDRGDGVAARRAFVEAVDVYSALGADWDIRRLDARTRPYGLRRHRRRAAGRPTSGWGSLTPTELKTAYLVARGLSNPDIAGELFLSRRTVQTHVSHILAKLGARSRSEIAREAAHHPRTGVSA